MNQQTFCCMDNDFEVGHFFLARLIGLMYDYRLFCVHWKIGKHNLYKTKQSVKVM